MSARRLAIWATPLGLAALFVVVAMPLIVTGWDKGRGWYDQHFYHEPAVRTFAQQWPAVDLHDYRSATTPGFHLLFAFMDRYFTSSRLGLQAAGAVFTVALVALLGLAAARRASAIGTPMLVPFIACAPFIASPYVFMSGAWLVPDNAGWLGVLALLLISLRPQFRWIDSIAAGAILAALVFTRQSHLWCAGLIWVWAWLGSGPFDEWSMPHLLARRRERIIAAAWAIAATLPAFAIVWYFHRLWGGLTPPSFQGQHAGGNLATPAFCLSLIAVYSVFFGAWCVPAIACLWRKNPRIVPAAALLGLALAIIAPTTYLDESRKSGLWNIVGFLDNHGLSIGGRTSPFIVLLSTAGAVCAAAWLSLLRPRERAVMAGGLAAFIAAQSFNANAWQRYLEPMFLMALALIVSGTPDRDDDAWSRRLRPMRLAGPVALAMFLALVTARGLLTDNGPGPPTASEPPTHPEPR